MKWQGHNGKAAERVSNFAVRVLNSRSMVVLTVIAVLVLVASASWKWGG